MRREHYKRLLNDSPEMFMHQVEVDCAMEKMNMIIPENPYAGEYASCIRPR